jgi:hypothetical protein
MKLGDWSLYICNVEQQIIFIDDFESDPVLEQHMSEAINLSQIHFFEVITDPNSDQG